MTWHELGGEGSIGTGHSGARRAFASSPGLAGSDPHRPSAFALGMGVHHQPTFCGYSKRATASVESGHSYRFLGDRSGWLAHPLMMLCTRHAIDYRSAVPLESGQMQVRTAFPVYARPPRRLISSSPVPRGAASRNACSGPRRSHARKARRKSTCGAPSWAGTVPEPSAQTG